MTSDLREQTYAKIQSFLFGNIEKLSSGSLVLAIVTIPRYWWAPIVMMVGMVIVGYFVLQRMNNLFDKMQNYMDRVLTSVKEDLQGMRVVKSFNQEDSEINKFNYTFDKLNDVNIQIGYCFSAIMPAFMLIAYIIISLVIFLVGKSIMAYPSDVAVVSPYFSYILTLLFAILNGEMMMSFSRVTISLGRIKEVLDTEPDIQFIKSDTDKPEKGSIEFDHVSFTYPGNNQPTLTDISFKAEPGQIVRIVGAMGSGKSTWAQLIPRLYDPTTGKIKIDGKNLKDIGKKSLKNTVSMAFQKAILSGTIASNLRQGKGDITNYELKRASEIVHAQEFVDQYHDDLIIKFKNAQLTFLVVKSNVFQLIGQS